MICSEALCFSVVLSGRFFLQGSLFSSGLNATEARNARIQSPVELQEVQVSDTTEAE